MSTASIILVLIVVFVVLALLGVPLAISMTLASLIPLLTILPQDMVFLTAAQNIVSGMNKFSLMAIPLFVLSGSILNEAGLAKKLVDIAKLFVGWVPGALFHMNIIANTLFGALSGSAIAAVSSMGKVMGPIEEQDGYDKDMSAAVNIASSPIGFLIPPNTGAIIFATLSNGAASVSTIFIAGYIPGLMLALGCMIVSYFFALKNGYRSTHKVSLKESISIIFQGLPVLFLMFLIIGGIVSGVFTASEASAIAAFYSFILALAYRALTWEKFWRIIDDTAAITATIFYLVSCSYILSWLLAYVDVPRIVGNSLITVSNNPSIVLLLITGCLFVLGMFLDVAPIITIFTPIFLPVVLKLGVHPVHFAIILTLTSSMGVCTPPVGTALFVGVAVAGTKLEKTVWYLIPLVGAMLAVTILNVFVPDFSLFIPRMLGLIN